MTFLTAGPSPMAPPLSVALDYSVSDHLHKVQVAW